MEDLIEEAVYVCEQEGKVVRMPVAPVERALTAGRLESIDGVGVYSLANGPDRAVGLAAQSASSTSPARRSDDRPVARCWPLLAIAIKARLARPRALPPGARRAPRPPFMVVKFRSMCSDAEERLDDLRAHNEINGHAFKLARRSPDHPRGALPAAQLAR